MWKPRLRGWYFSWHNQYTTSNTKFYSPYSVPGAIFPPGGLNIPDQPGALPGSGTSAPDLCKVCHQIQVCLTCRVSRNQSQAETHVSRVPVNTAQCAVPGTSPASHQGSPGRSAGRVYIVVRQSGSIAGQLVYIGCLDRTGGVHVADICRPLVICQAGGCRYKRN